MSHQVETKEDIHHLDNNDLEYARGKGERVEDEVAAELVDPTITISEEENKRLKWIIYKK
jgi:hypothetical protein